MGQLDITTKSEFRIEHGPVGATTDEPQIKVLVVEGNSDTRSSIRVVFAATGSFDLEFCCSDLEAMQKAVEFSPDVVFLDASLPCDISRTTLEALHAFPELDGVPIILATSSHLQSEIGRLYKLGAASVIARPYDPFEISGQVIKQWGQAHA